MSPFLLSMVFCLYHKTDPLPCKTLNFTYETKQLCEKKAALHKKLYDESFNEMPPETKQVMFYSFSAKCESVVKPTTK